MARHGTHPFFRFDVVRGTEGDDLLLFGDGDVLGAGGRGGNQVIDGLGGNDQGLAGDAREMLGDARGGNDIVIGGAGDDSFPGSPGPSGLAGDAITMRDDARGGRDLLLGGPGKDWLQGDANGMFGRARGGDDLLLGGPGDDIIWGDGNLLTATARGGDDHLVGGAGQDRFLFGNAFGRDVVLDFTQGEDRLGLSAFTTPGRYAGLGDLRIEARGRDTVILAELGSLVGTVVLKGFTGTLTADDLLA